MDRGSWLLLFMCVQSKLSKSVIKAARSRNLTYGKVINFTLPTVLTPSPELAVHSVRIKTRLATASLT